MFSLRNFFKAIKIGNHVLNSKTMAKVQVLDKEMINKKPVRSDVINFLISKNGGNNYLEIGVRNPDDNFNKIVCKNKYSVDPGIEFKSNPVDFKQTSDDFFNDFLSGNISKLKNIKFDLIFIDGLHLADQVQRDIHHALQSICDDGYIVLHDCCPPSEYHAREDFNFKLSPAGGSWNGTTWKAFYKARLNPSLYSCCVDSDWGVGIIAKQPLLSCLNYLPCDENLFYEFERMNKNRVKHLNLISFEGLKTHN